MARYDKYKHDEGRKKEANPIWRGIGCILIVVVPLIAFAMTVIFTPLLAHSGYSPHYLLGYIQFPKWIYPLPILGATASFIHSIANLYLGMIVFFVSMLLLIGVFSLIYVTVLQMIGPPRYSEKDAPPPRHRAKAYKR